MAGVVVGLDLGEALITARAYGARDDGAVSEYLSAIEAAAVVASARQAKTRS